MAMNVTIETRKALGLCVSCGVALRTGQDGTKHTRCSACRRVNADYMVRVLENRTKPLPQVQYQPAALACLRCSRTFKSWDKKQNRVCERCKESPEYQEIAC